MTDNFSKLYESIQRKHLRLNIHRIWKAAPSWHVDDLSEEDYKLYTIMQDHEEYREQFENADTLTEHEYDPNTEVNPFLHISLHQMVEDQIASTAPLETGLFYETMENQGYSHHEIVHLISLILIRITWDALLKQKPFDESQYRQILKAYRKKSPEEIPQALEKEFNDNQHRSDLH
jgi:hypothetical protein